MEDWLTALTLTTHLCSFGLPHDRLIQHLLSSLCVYGRPLCLQCGMFQQFPCMEDTAGQERFNSITSAYYRGAKGIVLVYDITKQETFEDLPKWMKMIDKYASEDAELLLVGNKLDCEADRVITRHQGERFASQISGMRFCEASAKDNFNVDEIFLKLVNDILNKLPGEIPTSQLSNSVLSLQPEPEVPPELPPPRPRCC
ncbi:ras-related protein Rab-12-like isoform X2 [Anguilla anguilla]|uniref:ras-related protein Rab-12-like isoform X2 n=1 Tax=Anguilla anguilla TaxID=7936 RepID=UPI0015B1718C|nr:ras-related protein Rab-12-like isoform X2 [Anguilla anguilla]